MSEEPRVLLKEALDHLKGLHPSDMTPIEARFLSLVPKLLERQDKERAHYRSALILISEKYIDDKTDEHTEIARIALGPSW